MTGLGRWIAGLSGWRRWLLAAGLGAAAALAFAPIYALPLLIPSFTGVVLMIAAADRLRGAFATGWAFGFGFFLVGLYWVGNAFAAAGVPGWLAPPAILALAALCGLFSGTVALATALAGLRGPGLVLVFAASWTVGEWLRGQFPFGGLPWNLTGYVWAWSDAMIQIAAVTGIYGLSLLTVLAAAMPAVLVHAPAANRARYVAWLALAASWAVLVLVYAGGAWRLAGAETGNYPGVTLRLVQPSIDQRDKWRKELRDAHFARHLELSSTPAETPPTHVVWPESATPFILARHPEALQAIAAMLPEGGALLTGTERVGDLEAKPIQFWNSLVAIDHLGQTVASYDKAHLVPFGEYVPLRRLMPFAKLTHGELDFSRGPGPRTLRVPGLPPVSPLICYEAIFSGRVIDASDPPAWLLNVTNDAWYGTSAGPHQHLAQARLRAVEHGMALVRVANNGISAVIDPYGRVLSSLALNRVGIIDSPLPRAIASGTIFGRLGAAPAGAMILLALAAAFAMRRI